MSHYCPNCEHPVGYHTEDRGCTMPVLPGTHTPKGRFDSVSEPCGCGGTGRTEMSNLKKTHDVVLGKLEGSLPTFYSATARQNLADDIVSSLEAKKLIAPETRTVYIVKQNTDLTEGRGHMIAVAEFENLDAAVADANKRGVQGTGSGDVHKVTVSANGLRGTETKIYGYRKRPDGKWDYGYLDCRDLTNDPDYTEYVRLAKKFGAL